MVSKAVNLRPFTKNKFETHHSDDIPGTNHRIILSL